MKGTLRIKLTAFCTEAWRVEKMTLSCLTFVKSTTTATWIILKPICADFWNIKRETVPILKKKKKKTQIAKIEVSHFFMNGSIKK